mgnify:CR=1 FL=1
MPKTTVAIVATPVTFSENIHAMCQAVSIERRTIHNRNIGPVTHPVIRRG